MKTCPKCGGHKIIEAYKHVEAGICFECSGRGSVTDEEYIRIEKEIAKEIKKNSKMLENSKKKLLQNLKKEWFSNCDVIYIVCESNTYNIKDQIKKDGGKFNSFSVWYFTEPKDNYNLIKISWEEVLQDDNKGYATNMTNIIKEKSNGILKGF